MGPCPKQEAIEANFGEAPGRPHNLSAYMLVYVREDKAAALLAPPHPKTTNPRMVERLLASLTPKTSSQPRHPACEGQKAATSPCPEDEESCAICLVEARSHAFLPCGHRCV